MPRNTKENAELTRQQLLDAAQRLFAANGIDGTSLDHIASAANVTRGAVYWHFRDKQHLLYELYQRLHPLITSLRTKLEADMQINPALALWRHGQRVLTVIRDDEIARCLTSIILLRNGDGAGANNEESLDLGRQLSGLKLMIDILSLANEQHQLLPDTNIYHAGLALQSSLRGAAGMMLSLPQYFDEKCEAIDLIRPYYRGILVPEVWQAIQPDKDY